MTLPWTLREPPGLEAVTTARCWCGVRFVPPTTAPDDAYCSRQCMRAYEAAVVAATGRKHSVYYGTIQMATATWLACRGEQGAGDERA